MTDVMIEEQLKIAIRLGVIAAQETCDGHYDNV